MDESIQMKPIRCLTHIRDLINDVYWNYEINQHIRLLKPKPREADGTYMMQQKDIERIQEFHKYIKCFLCQNVCHFMRNQQVKEFAGPRFLIHIASLAYPLDTLNRLKELKNIFGIGYWNITKCCTKVYPEYISITDNAIIPLKERVDGAYYDPLALLWRILTSVSKKSRRGFNKVS
jgi:succinate dehydrogenase / fumarate reductase iron-sulfur subunit